MIIVLEKDSFDWVALTGAITSVLAVIVAIITIWLQNKQFKKQREPVIKPAMKTFDVKLPEINLDWETGKKLDSKFSSTTIPVYNYGGTSAINISYSYTFTNLKAVKESLDKIQGFEDGDVKISDVNEENNSFDLCIESPSGWRRFNEIKRYVRFQDVILPGNNVNILLPSYFVVIINYAFQFDIWEDIEFPELELSLTYNDVSDKYWNVKYIIKLDTKTYNRKSGSDGVYLKSHFINEFVSQNPIKGIIRREL